LKELKIKKRDWKDCYICHEHVNPHQGYYLDYIPTLLCKAHVHQILGYLEGAIRFSKRQAHGFQSDSESSKEFSDGELAKIAWEYMRELKGDKKEEVKLKDEEPKEPKKEKTESDEDEESEEDDGKLKLKPPRRNW